MKCVFLLDVDIFFLSTISVDETLQQTIRQIVFLGVRLEERGPCRRFATTGQARAALIDGVLFVYGVPLLRRQSFRAPAPFQFLLGADEVDRDVVRVKECLQDMGQDFHHGIAPSSGSTGRLNLDQDTVDGHKGLVLFQIIHEAPCH